MDGSSESDQENMEQQYGYQEKQQQKAVYISILDIKKIVKKMVVWTTSYQYNWGI